MVSWNWKPCISVDEFTFGAAFVPANVKESIQLLPPAYEDDEWNTYRIGDEIGRVSVSDVRIISVECSVSMCFNGHELIGKTPDDVNQLLPVDAQLSREYDHGDERWACEELGLILWVENGRVTSVTVSAVSDDDES